MQLSPCEGRLQHVGSINGTFSGTGSDHCMQLVNEQDYLSISFCHFLKYGLQAIFKLSSVFSSGHQGAYVQTNYPFAFKVIGHVTVDYTLSKPLYNCCLTYTGLTNKHGVILCPS